MIVLHTKLHNAFFFNEKKKKYSTCPSHPSFIFLNGKRIDADAVHKGGMHSFIVKKTKKEEEITNG